MTSAFFSDSKEFLNRAAKSIEVFLHDHLKLSFSKCQLFPVTRGVDFLGYRHFKKYILLRKSTTKRVKKRLSALPWLLENGKITKERLRSSLASTWGWLKWADTYNLRLTLDMRRLERMCIMPNPKRFSDFAEEEKAIDGDKVKIESILNKEIRVTD